MNFHDFLETAGDRLADDDASVARFEYVWNSAIRAAAAACQTRADAMGNPIRRETATICAETVMELWTNPLVLR